LEIAIKALHTHQQREQLWYADQAIASQVGGDYAG
jgi:hypothetical protein